MARSTRTTRKVNKARKLRAAPKPSFRGTITRPVAGGRTSPVTGGRTPLSPTEPRPSTTTLKPKAKAEAALAQKKDFPKKEGETDEAYAARLAAHKENRKELTKSLMKQTGSKFNDDYSKKEKRVLAKSREAFKDLGAKRDELREKVKSADLTAEEKAKIEADLATVKTERQEANETLAESRDARREEAKAAYIKQLKAKAKGKDATLYMDKDRSRRLKKARYKARRPKKRDRGTFTVK